MPSRQVTQWWRETIAGRRIGLSATTARLVLWLAEFPYATVVALRNSLYDRRHVAQAAVPVVSVGNLTVGGTGKTPCVRWLAKWLADLGHQPAILSRGYRTDGERGCNDEALELARRLPDIVHLQHRDRVATANQAVVDYGANVLVLDDGFQHRRLARDIDIVLIDATCPWGFGHLLPRGMLRESPRSLNRADVAIVTRADSLDQDGRATLLAEIRSHNRDIVLATVTERPIAWVDIEGRESPVNSVSAPLQPFCGIGNPASFARTLQSLGGDTLPIVEFPDHHHYTTDDLRRVEQQARNGGAASIVCTEKDLVKIDRCMAHELPLHALRIDWSWQSGREAVEELILDRLAVTRAS